MKPITDPKPAQRALFQDRDGVVVACTIDKVKQMFGEKWVKIVNAYKWHKLADIKLFED